ncbi:hypothetical protein EVAR_29363_1 [Eumeta japonica]|uniref:Uncharacterized protein n=1 Tax=Eumeta variegata TaxID=151549 RepID=A0A4C1WKF7_EUMVA|nr:hypothetical protein EVAR_29363_1 [Eumeta japonica]
MQKRLSGANNRPPRVSQRVDIQPRRPAREVRRAFFPRALTGGDRPRHSSSTGPAFCGGRRRPGRRRSVAHQTSRPSVYPPAKSSDGHCAGATFSECHNLYALASQRRPTYLRIVVYSGSASANDRSRGLATLMEEAGARATARANSAVHTISGTTANNPAISGPRGEDAILCALLSCERRLLFVHRLDKFVYTAFSTLASERQGRLWIPAENVSRFRGELLKKTRPFVPADSAASFLPGHRTSRTGPAARFPERVYCSEGTPPDCGQFSKITYALVREYYK